MKTNFRNLKFGLIASVLLAISICIFSCEKTMDDFTLNDNPPTSEPDPGFDMPPFVDGEAQNNKVTGGPNDVAFDYKLKTSYCSRYGTNVAVLIEFAKAYRVRWDVDGKDCGNGIKLNCVRGREATAYVTRMKDDVTVIKSCKLRAKIKSISPASPHKLFNIAVKMTRCYDGKYTLSAFADNQSQFDFTWAVDGEYALDQPVVECICAEKAMLTIKRKSDGVSQYRTITLPPCYSTFETSPSSSKTKPNTFDFTLKLKTCEDGNVNVQIDILHPQLYGILWKLNGQKAGHGKSLSCVCGKKAEVRVMRFSDGLAITKSITLPVCTSKS